MRPAIRNIQLERKCKVKKTQRNISVEERSVELAKAYQVWNWESGYGITLCYPSMDVCVLALNALINMVDVTNLPSSG